MLILANFFQSDQVQQKGVLQWIEIYRITPWISEVAIMYPISVHFSTSQAEPSLQGPAYTSPLSGLTLAKA